MIILLYLLIKFETMESYNSHKQIIMKKSKDPKASKRAAFLSFL
jgi:hypothetical protein